MRLARLLTLLAALLLCAPSHAQTIKSLGFNTTNGFVVYGGTNALTFTNSLQFATSARAATRTNLGLGTAAVEAATAFQPASANLTNLALNDAAGLTNFPTLNQNTAGTASNVTGTVAVANGGTGATNSNAARTNLGVAPAPIFKVLTNAFSITNQTNMTTVDGLTFSTAGGKAYVVKLFPIISADVSGASFQIVATNATVYGNWDSITSASYTITPLTNSLTGLNIVTARVPVQNLYIVANTNAGSIAFQISSSVATNTITAGAGSYMMAQEVTPTP